MSDDTKMTPGGIRFGPVGEEPKTRSEFRALTSLAERIHELESQRDAARSERDEAEEALKTIFSTLLPVTNTADSTTTGMARKAVDLLVAARAEVEELKAALRTQNDLALERLNRAVAAEATAERWQGALQEIAAMECSFGGFCDDTVHFGQPPDPLCAVCRARRALAASTGKEPNDA